MYGDISNYTTKYYEALSYLLGDRKKEALKTIGEMLASKPNNIEAYILKGRLGVISQDSLGDGRQYSRQRLHVGSLLD